MVKLDNVHWAEIVSSSLYQSVMILIISLLTSASVHAAAEVSASVDRTRLNADETLVLSIRTPDLEFTGEPQLSLLEETFEILSQQVRTHTRILNGDRRSERIWTITLLPRRPGTLIIPSISVGHLKTRPITLEVTSSDSRGTESADLFLYSELDQQNTAYVQQQLIYTLRLYYAAEISDHGITPLELSHVLIVPLGNRNVFQARVDDRVYNVVEWKFAIYPQKSGELVVPAQEFSGRMRVLNRYSLGNFRQIRVRSPEHRIQIQPVPDSFPSGAQWLPAYQLELSQTFSHTSSQWQTGQPVTRTLTLEADGLTAAQLPPIELTESPLLRHYPEPAKLDDLPMTDQDRYIGIKGRKSLSAALIPVAEGDLTLPEIRVPWWNLSTNQLEYATLPAYTARVQPNPDQPELRSGTEPAPQQIAAPQSTETLWPWATLFSSLTALTLGLLWWQSYRQLKQLQLSLHIRTSTHSDGKNDSKADAYLRQQLLKACQQHDARAAWKAWSQWQKHSAVAPDPLLKAAIDHLQQHLFSPDNNTWQPEQLAQACRQYQPAQRAVLSPPLPDLYPK